jgi:hypothetical protein
MKIGIIGAGNIGSTLGKKWAAAGHEVRFGVRNPADPKYAGLHAFGPSVTVAEATAFGEIIVLAVPGSAVPGFVMEHAALLAGKTVIDTTNNPRDAVMNNLGPLAEYVPTARLVRAFSTLGWENFATPEINGVQIDLYYCAHPSAQPTAERLIADVGLHPVYVGGIQAARALDGITRLWFALVFDQGFSRRTAFQLLKED